MIVIQVDFFFALAQNGLTSYETRKKQDNSILLDLVSY